MRHYASGFTKNVALVVLACFFSASSITAYCTTALEVIPYDGSINLDFGRIIPEVLATKELTIKVTSDTPQQYQIYEKVINAFRNERGEPLMPNVLQRYSLRGSNSSGTMYLENPTPLMSSEELIYTSSATSLNEQFVLVYTANAEGSAGGNYHGKLLYTLRPLDGSAPQEFFLDVYLTIGSQFSCTAVTSSPSGTRLELSTQNDAMLAGAITVSFKGNAGGVLMLHHAINRMPVNERMEEFPIEQCRFWLSKNSDAGDFLTPALPQESKALIYQTTASEDEVSLFYKIDKDAASVLPAGTYTGEITLTISHGEAQEMRTVPFSIEIPPMFSLETTMPDGGIYFPKLEFTSPEQFKEVYIKVTTNVRRPYIVTQNLAVPPTNEKGNILQDTFFTARTELARQGDSEDDPYELGTAAIGDFSPVGKDQTVFLSDEKGTSSRFKIIYRAKPSFQMPSGDYRVKIDFGLQEK